MSSLWTPSGEHPVDRSGGQRPGGTPSPGAGASEATGAPPPGGAPGAGEPELTAEQRAAAEEYARQLDEAHRQIAQTPAGLVVGQQALQFYEVAAIHLSQPEPKLAEAQIAIDALAAVVDRLGSRLGEAESALRQALHQIQLAFVEVSKQAAPESDA